MAGGLRLLEYRSDGAAVHAFATQAPSTASVCDLARRVRTLPHSGPAEQVCPVCRRMAVLAAEALIEQVGELDRGWPADEPENVLRALAGDR